MLFDLVKNVYYLVRWDTERERGRKRIPVSFIYVFLYCWLWSERGGWVLRYESRSPMKYVVSSCRIVSYRVVLCSVSFIHSFIHVYGTNEYQQTHAAQPRANVNWSADVDVDALNGVFVFILFFFLLFICCCFWNRLRDKMMMIRLVYLRMDDSVEWNVESSWVRLGRYVENFFRRWKQTDRFRREKERRVASKGVKRCLLLYPLPHISLMLLLWIMK